MTRDPKPKQSEGRWAAMMRRTCLERFAGDRKGAVAMLFAGALVPVIAVVGIAVDYSRASNVRVQLQAAADAAAMAGAVSKTTTTAARTAAAEQSFDANTANLKHGATATRTATPGSDQVTVTASATLPTVFMKLVGTSEMTMSTESTVYFGGGTKKLEVALVLDTTGSMNGTTSGSTTKLDELKAAVPMILDVVMPAGSTNTKVAMVPFATYVNVGSTNTAQLTGRVSPYQYKQCVLERKHGSRPTESAPDINVDEFWIKTSNSSCSSTKPIIPLTSNRSTIDTAVTSLTASGSTSGHLGIQWGWHAISPEWSSRWPAGSEPVAYTDATTIKAIVVLTDGNFTEFHRNQDKSAAYCSGGSDCPESRAEAKAYCDAIKTKLNADGEEAVMIFTIGFGLEPESSSAGQKARDTMKYCASYDQTDPETNLSLKKKHFYFPVTQQDLEDAFSSIGDALIEALGNNNPRLSQ
ncbi:MAG: pilus assembly protein TadG-related protein [Hyphomicrobiaceae bacterium]